MKIKGLHKRKQEEKNSESRAGGEGHPIWIVCQKSLLNCPLNNGCNCT